MKAISIPQLLNARENTETLEFQEFIAGLETLTPVRGRLKVTHGRTYLEVSAQAEAIATLCCHRCLQHYNHRLTIDTTELIWLEEEDEEDIFPCDRETKLEDLAEALSPRGYFHPEVWLYEQFCLALPVKQICSPQCQGIALNSASGEPEVDGRWESLKALKDRLS